MFLDAGQAFAIDWAEKMSPKTNSTGRQYVRQSVVVFESVCSITVGLATVVGLNGVAGLRTCFDPGLILSFLPVATLLGSGLALKMMAVRHFHAGAIKIVGQLRLPCIVLFSTLLLGRRYSIVQWQVLAMITTSCIAFVLLKGGGREREGKAWNAAGMCQVLAWVLLNVLGGIAAEHTYKSRVALPYYMQKVSADCCFLLVSLVMLLVVVPYFQPDEDICDKRRRPNGFFDSWDMRTVVVVAFLYLDAWVGNLLLKEFSGVTRSIAKAFGVSIVYFVSLLYAKGGRSNASLSLLAISVLQSSILFALVS